MYVNMNYHIHAALFSSLKDNRQYLCDQASRQTHRIAVLHESKYCYFSTLCWSNVSERNRRALLTGSMWQVKLKNDVNRWILLTGSMWQVKLI